MSQVGDPWHEWRPLKNVSGVTRKMFLETFSITSVPFCQIWRIRGVQLRHNKYPNVVPVFQLSNKKIELVQ